ncbi:hypothetical protein [Actomonas aquatica]|uniref:Sulfotransferase family protein n=1 Tax=Actomonas aquatica TaxID=2866162 RepID=A0ABZ1C648_9BACT|nr:hypothetical protein [Opitutus sp. WL0086]WRQ86738.1 hypothetical protein K1X11_018150 [Opitutus sp. WL0086]
MRWRNQLGRVLPPINRRCVTPPGELRPRPGRPILVASLMRSGTHLAIDLILNNFAAYRHNPLYLDLDGYLLDGRAREPLLACGAYVAKTHHPHRPVPADQLEALRRFAATAVVVTPVREAEAVSRSLASFGESETVAEVAAMQAQAQAFWAEWDPVAVDFAELTDWAGSAGFLARLAERAGVPVPARVVENPPRSATGQVLWAKLWTRLLGSRAARINTTIQFDSTRS